MPFRDEFAVIRKAILDAAERAKVRCVFADDNTQAGQVSDQIVAEIRRSWACIAEITGQNPNVAWEIGFAQALGKPVMPITDAPLNLFFDLKDQRTIIYDRRDLGRTLTQTLTAWLERLLVSKPFVPPEDLLGTEGHEGTSSVLAMKRIAGTPYGFFDIVTKARKHVFMAAQNHFYFTENPERKRQFQEAIGTFLSADSTRTFDVMLCEPSADYSVRTWQYVTAQRYERDLNAASAYFEELTAWAEETSDFAQRLTIRRVPFVPISVTFVDPNDRHGFLVLTPNAYQEKDISRPSFVISRLKNDDIFHAYWAAYLQRFHDLGARL